MKFMQRKLALAVVAMALCGVQTVSAAPPLSDGDMISLAASRPRGSGSGGEFTVMSGSGSFITFCVEKNEYLTLPGGPYAVTVRSYADAGGLAGGSPDPLSNATAWLFTKYLAGDTIALPGWSASGNTTANDAQDAIWYLESEMGWGSLSLQAQTWANNATAAAGFGDTDSNSNVKVLNLWDSYSVTKGGIGYHQDLLLAIPEPETYAMLLAGLGLMGFMARRRKQNAAA